MIGIKEFQKKKENTASFGKKLDNVAKLAHNPCGSYNDCHQMTGNHAVNGRQFWQEANDAEHGQNLQRSCAITFLQRNLGNSYLKSLTGVPNNLVPFPNMPLAQRKPT